MDMKRMGRLAWLIVLGMSTLGGLVGAHADELTWNGGATKSTRDGDGCMRTGISVRPERRLRSRKMTSTWAPPTLPARSMPRL